MADITTKYDMQMMHLIPDVIKLSKAADNDTFSLTKYAGVILIGKHVFTVANNATTNNDEYVSYGVGKVNNTSTAYTATSTSIVYDGAAATRIIPGYVLTASGEIMYVIADTGKATTGGTMTVRRGCLGTTASATGLADNDPLYFLNQIVMTDAAVGIEFLLVFPLPNDPGVPLFSAQRES